MKTPIFLAMVAGSVAFLIAIQASSTEQEEEATPTPNPCTNDDESKLFQQVSKLKHKSIFTALSLLLFPRIFKSIGSSVNQTMTDFPRDLQRYCEDDYPSYKNQTNEGIRLMKLCSMDDFYAYDTRRWRIHVSIFDYACRNHDKISDFVTAGGLDCVRTNFRKRRECVDGYLARITRIPLNSTEKLRTCVNYRVEHEYHECLYRNLNVCPKLAAAEMMRYVSQQLSAMISCDEVNDAV